MLSRSASREATRTQVYTSLLLTTLRFICGGKKICSIIKKSQNIMNMIAGLLWRKYNQIHLIGGFNIEEYNKQKQPFRGVFKKRCSENMQQIYRRTPMPKCDFNKEIALRHGCSPVNLLHTFRTPFLKDIPGRLLPNKRNDKRFNYCSYSLFYFMGIVLKHLWLIPNILRLESSVSLKNFDFFF